MDEIAEKLWAVVSDGKPKQLEKFLTENRSDRSFKSIINYRCELYDEDGGNVITHCIKQGRDKAPSFGKDYQALITVLVENGVDVNAKDKARRTPLFWACQWRYVNTVSRLLVLGADVSVKDQDGNNPFHISVQLGHKDVVSMLLDHDPKLTEVHGSHGVPPLVIAVKYGQLETCRLLLERGSDPDGREQRTRRSPVYHAIRNRYMDILDLLLRYNPKVDTVDTEGRSILYLVCECPDVRFFHKLLSYCPKFSKTIMDTPADENKTPVIIACQQGHAEQLKHLLEEGADTKAVDVYKKTALHYCADNLETQCAEMLLAKDMAIIDNKDEQGYTALALSVLVGNVNFIKLLLDKGADIETRDEEGHKLSHWAAVCGHLKVLDVLIQHGADMESRDVHHAYPIHYAAQMNSQNSGISDPKISEKVLKKVLDCKVKLSVVDDAGRQPLLWAACSGNAESCRMLLKAGAEVNSVDKDSLTALHCAASRGHHQCIEVLRKQGAELNRTDKNDCTPLFYAITLGNKDCTKALLTAKADVNHIDGRGRNPAHCASIKGCLDTIKMLEKESCDLWHQNNKGDYPVHEAAQTGHLDVVKYLLRHRNDVDAVNVVNNVGKTLLHIAAATNNLPLCKLIMNYDNCNKSALMKHGGKEFTPYDLAVIKGYAETADYLKSKGALAHSDVTNIEKKTEKEKTPTADKTDKKKEEVKRPSSAKPTVVARKQAVVKDNKRSKGKGKGKEEKGKENEIPKQQQVGKEEEDKNVTATKTEKSKTEEKESKVQSKPETPKGDNSEGVEEESKGVDLKPEPPVSKESDKKQQQQSPSKRTVSVGEKADPIRTSPTSVRDTDTPFRDDTPTQDNTITQPATSPMGGQSSSTKKQPDTGKFVSLEKYDETDIKPDDTTKKSGKRNKVGFNHTAISDNEDSGNETDRSLSRSRGHRNATLNKRLVNNSRKSYVNNVKDSVRTYQRKRASSRSIQQLRRAQIHSGPMHDIVMFSKMMDQYRQGLGPDETEVDVRQYANWDGYLNDQLRFVSCLYSEDSRSPMEIQETAKEQHEILENEANRRKVDTDKRCDILQEYEGWPTTKHNTYKDMEIDSQCIYCNRQESADRQTKRNKDMDREIDQLANRTAEMFDSVQHVASSSLNSAKSRNQKLRDEMRRTREEKLRDTDDPHERAMLQRQELEDRIAEQQEEMDSARRLQHKSWYRRKDEEMRQRLLMAYRPTFPNDVFASKSVCVSGGRVKSAGRLRVDSAATPRPRRSPVSPRPGSHKSGDSSNYSAAQYRLKGDNVQVQMTPYGLRRVRNQERPTYDRRARVHVFKCEITESHPNLGYDPDQIMNTIRYSASPAYTANWSRKYDGSIRPRTGLVFVEPRVYDDLMREEQEAKQRISTTVRHQYTNGSTSQLSLRSTEHTDSPLP